MKDQDATKSVLSTDTPDRDSRQPAARDNVEQAKHSDDHEQPREGPAEHKVSTNDTDATETNSDGDEN